MCDLSTYGCCAGLLPPGDIPQHTEDCADEPGQTGGPPDAPHADGWNQHHQHRKADTADHLYHTVDESEQCIADTVQDAAGHVDGGKEDVEDTGQAQCLCTDLDYISVIDEDGDNRYAEGLVDGEHQQ